MFINDFECHMTFLNKMIIINIFLFILFSLYIKLKGKNVYMCIQLLSKARLLIDESFERIKNEVDLDTVSLLKSLYKSLPARCQLIMNQ